MLIIVRVEARAARMMKEAMTRIAKNTDSNV